MIERMRIPKGKTHEVLIAFRDEISVGFYTQFCNEMNVIKMEHRDDYGIVATILANDEMMEYIDQEYDHAISMMCDMDQKVNDEPAPWTVKQSETRTLQIIRCGNSLAINVTAVCNNLRLQQGDNVKVTIETL